MNDETERIYKELLKQYADAFTQAGKDGSEKNVRHFRIIHDLALDLLHVELSKKRAIRLLDATAARTLNKDVNYEDIDDFRALDATYYLWLYCQRQGAGTHCDGCAIGDWCIGLGPYKCPGNLITGEGEDGE
ncbi:hypothetical protein [Megasphaera sp.]|uniref:hypothetical protein n=1 Tax=Megasphaera sp. TaxID=2023260 RepID=UPI00307EC522